MQNSREDIAWKQFIQTGRIEAYLRYRGIRERLDDKGPVAGQAVHPPYTSEGLGHNHSIKG